MLRLAFAASVCVLALQLVAPAGAAETNGGPAVGVRTTDLGRVKAAGWLGDRVDRAHRAVQNVRSSIWWNLGNVWGWEHAARWLRNMSYFAAYTGEKDPAVAEVAERFVRMFADGSLLPDYQKLHAGPYEDGESLRGLLAYYELSGDQRILEAAKGVGRNIADHHHLTKHYYKPLAITPLLKLSALSGDASLRKLALEIAEEKQLEFLTMKSHGAAAAEILEGYLDLYELTRDDRYLDWAKQGWQATKDRAFVTGGLGEVLDFAAEPTESDVLCETCQTSRWMIFNLRMWHATGDTRYVDMAEQILYNHFASSQSHRGEGGGFCAGGNIDQGVRGVHNYFCCDNEGTVGLLEVLRNIYTLGPAESVVGVNLFFDSEARFDIGGRSVGVRQRTEYPERGAVILSVDTGAPVRFTLSVRVPKWTSVARATVNGKPVKLIVSGSRLSVTRSWASGDTLKVVFPLSMRVEADMTGRDLRSGAVSINGYSERAKRIAVFYGPVLTAMFRTGHGNDLSWIWTGDYTDVLDCGGDAGLGYPGSKPDILELDSKVFDTGGVPELTTVKCGSSVPEISWSAGLGDKARVNYSAKVLPGLPVTIESREEVTGWDGQGRLLCSGLRFATIKDASGNYGVCSVPYPMPCVTTKPDLDNHVVWAGVYGLFERMSNDGELPVTGTFFLNNGYFGAICTYNSDCAQSLVCKQTEKYCGLYIQPKAGAEVMISRRIVFPLLEKPLNQTTVRQMAEKAGQVSARIDGKSGSLVLDGPVLQGVPVPIPRKLGLQAGCVLYNDDMASYAFDLDAESLVCCVDVPGVYEVVRASR